MLPRARLLFDEQPGGPAGAVGADAVVARSPADGQAAAAARDARLSQDAQPQPAVAVQRQPLLPAGVQSTQGGPDGSGRGRPLDG